MIPNDLWIKGSEAPRALPYSDYDDEGNIWDHLAGNEEGRLATGWVKAPDYPDYDSSTQEPVWNNGSWSLQAKPPAPYLPVRVSKIDFTRLFTFEEQVLFEYQTKVLATMSPLDFAANIPMQMLAVVFRQFQQPAEFIELNHPDTVTAISVVLVGAGILSTERAAQVLAGVVPV